MSRRDRSIIYKGGKEPAQRPPAPMAQMYPPKPPPRSMPSKGVPYWQAKYQDQVAARWEAEAERDEWKQKYETLLQQRYATVYDGVDEP